MSEKNKIDAALQQEWLALHQSDERSETLSLLIKLLAVILCVTGWALSLNVYLLVLLLAVLWLQEGIWKTFQSRTQQRLLDLERAISGQGDTTAFQFYHEWQQRRPRTVELMGQYLRHALRPTVAYPYAVLIALVLATSWLL
jgi:hypothetical protein